MRRNDFRGPGLAAAVLTIAALLGACGPAPQSTAGAAPPTAASQAASSSPQSLTPATTPDPVPAQTIVPGQHLDVIGTITALGTSTIDVDGATYNITPATEVKGSLAVGGQVKLEYITNADGSRTVIEAKAAGFFDDSGSSSDG